MFGFDCTAACVDGRAVDGVDAEQVDGEAGSDDIADGIDGAHFVEVDFFEGRAVNGGFGFGEGAEDAFGGGFHGFGEGGGGDQVDDVVEVPVFVLFFEGDFKFGGGDATAVDAVPGEGGSGSEAVEGGGKGDGVGSGIGEGSDEHIAGEAGEGVDVADGSEGGHV